MLLLQDPDYCVPDASTPGRQPSKKYCTTKLDGTITSMARFTNMGYGQASHVATGMARDLGHKDIRITKKIIRSQLEAKCKKEIKRLADVSPVQGRLITECYNSHQFFDLKLFLSCKYDAFTVAYTACHTMSGKS